MNAAPSRAMPTDIVWPMLRKATAARGSPRRYSMPNLTAAYPIRYAPAVKRRHLKKTARRTAKRTRSAAASKSCVGRTGRDRCADVYY